MSVAAQVLGSINNWFESSPSHGSFEVAGGTLSAARGTLPALAETQYYLIRGSVLNDGLHEWGRDDLVDEGPWEGDVVPCAVPRDLRDLIGEVEDWQKAHGTAAGPYQSESFDGYSYSLATDGTTGGAMTWQAAFRSRLNRWRKL